MHIDLKKIFWATIPAYGRHVLFHWANIALYRSTGMPNSAHTYKTHKHSNYSQHMKHNPNLHESLRALARLLLRCF